MEQQQEIGGAQALLLLGSKKDEEELQQENKDDLDVDLDKNDIDDNNDSEPDLTDGKATNQQINDAVEAAVMRYVGGTLEDNGIMKRKRKSSHSQTNNLHEDLMSNINEISQWTGFLEDEIESTTAGSGAGDVEHGDNTNASQVDFSHYSPKLSKKRKKRKTGPNDIDPELAGLDSSAEHDQLVQATIMDARELAKQLSNGGLLQDHGLNSLHNSLHGLPPQQAQQVIAAATAAVQNHGHGNPESTAAINQLAQAASSIGRNGQDKNRKSLKKNDSFMNYGLDQVVSPQRKTKFNHLTSVEALLEEASAQACDWYNSLPQTSGNGPRIFSPEEIAAVDHFITGYCHLHKITRKDICNRIWSNERKKDNFWELLTRVLPYRSRASVYKHVRRQYHVFEVRAKWVKEDDDLLRKLASTKEGNWKEIGDIMGRMPEDCRDRWRNYVKCGENRVLNKWSEEEEAKLREIVIDMLAQAGDHKDKPQTVNWTIVSERMNGVRSRIQCRYKWNKLVRRDSVARSTFMSEDTRLWLLQQLQRLDFLTLDSVDWGYIVQLYHQDKGDKVVGNENWTASDFKVGFEKMKSDIKDHKKLPLQTVVQKLLDDIYSRNGSVEPSRNLLDNGQLNQSFMSRSETNGDPTDSIESTAVAAVSAVGGDGQEYGLWR